MTLIKYDPKFFDIISLAQWLRLPEQMIPDFLNQWKESSRNPNMKYVLGYQNKNNLCAFLEIRQTAEREWLVMSHHGKQSEVCFLVQKFAKKFNALSVELWSSSEMPGFDTTDVRYGLKFTQPDTKKESPALPEQETPSGSPGSSEPREPSTSPETPTVTSEDNTPSDTEVFHGSQPGPGESPESSGNSI